MDNLENIKSELSDKMYNKNLKFKGFDIHRNIAIMTFIILVTFISVSVIFPQITNRLFESIKIIIINKFDWLFILSSNFFILIVLYFAFSKYGNVRIGGIESTPEYSNFAWYSMLISAGMGIGLLFWSVGEPLIQSVYSPVYASTNSKTTALATTFLHWGIHPWAIYALVAVILAFNTYNRGLPLSLRSAFYPFLKNKIYGPIGDLIDTLSVIACLFGLATSLGFGVQQINSGLNLLFRVPINNTIQVLLIFIITSIAVISVVSGVDKGVRLLSEWNVKIAALLMLALFLFGFKGNSLRLIINSVGLYLNDLVSSSFYIDTSKNGWQGKWTIFYLSWWISWSPFVGTFIAQISKGRTIREFVTAVLIVPTVLSFLWIGIFGSNAILINSINDNFLLKVVSKDPSSGIFEMFRIIDYPFLGETLKIIFIFVTTVLIIFFFVTSSDSGSLVVNNIMAGGKLITPKFQKVVIAFMEGIIASILLLIGGNQALESLQTAVIITGLPFVIILIIASFGLLKSINKAQKKQKATIALNTFKELYRKAFELEEKRHFPWPKIKKSIHNIDNKEKKNND